MAIESKVLGTEKLRRSQPEPIAVIGMALRVPGANSLNQFWHNIAKGKDSLTRPSTKQLREAGVTRKQIADPLFIRSKPLLDDIDYFDASFFDMAAFEAERTDPGNRLFLECAWDAMEDAGVIPGTKGIVAGVYGGIERWYMDANLLDYGEVGNADVNEVEDMGRVLPTVLGNAIEYFTTRISYKLNLTGPSFTVMAACATSLVAIHLATQALRRRECNLALVGGACVEVPHVGGYMSTVDGMLSTSGRVSPFDSKAAGTIFGSGVGAVVLRPLDDALADGNPIYGLIKGTAIANDGNSEDKESFIAPSSVGQCAVVEEALADGKIPPRSIGYLEAHGTATELGDPIEISSITDVYSRYTASTEYCALGSVKANVGHLRTAAGIISLIKACLTLKHQVLPPLVNYTQHNTRINLKESPFFINTDPLEWTENSHPRRAAVSSFGFGGSNAHVIVEEFMPRKTVNSTRTDHLYVFSAQTDSALNRRIVDLAIFLDEHSDTNKADVAYSLLDGRAPMMHRACFQVNDIQPDPLHLLRGEPTAAGFTEVQNGSTIFLFPGQGAQKPGMGQDIYSLEPLYRHIIDHCAEVLHEELRFDIRTLIHIGNNNIEHKQSQLLQQTANTQPALFVVEYALSKLFLSWGIKPQAMIGHSIGEIVAACLAGVFSLEDALVLVANRAKLMQECDSGEMYAVFLTEFDLKDILEPGIEIAAVNAPQICVVSGPGKHIQRFVKKLSARNVITRQIQTSHAFHSRMMEPALPAFRKVVDQIELHAPQIPVISNTTGLPLSKEQATNPEYWSEHIRHGVRFSNSVEFLIQESEQDLIFLELGPGTGLVDLVHQQNTGLKAVSALETGVGERGDVPNPALVALGQLWCKGATVEWKELYANEHRKKISLPAYPYERQRLWLERGDLETDSDGELKQYSPGWTRADIESDDIQRDERFWFIFCDELGLGQSITKVLRLQDQSVIEVVPGRQFSEISPKVYSVRPNSKEDLQEALQLAIAGNSGLTIRVVHLWSLTGAAGPHNSVEAFESSIRTGYLSLMCLIQAANELKLCDDFDLMLVTDGIRQMPDENVELYAEKGALLGPLRNVPTEFPGTTMRCIDLSGLIGDEIPEWISKAIIDEAEAVQKKDIVLLRSQGRYIEEFYTLDLKLGRPRLREFGTVFITGGVGALGLEVAETLFDISNAQLVLTSRWQPPPKDQWAERAVMDDKVGKSLKRVLELEARGAKVLIVTADTTDCDSLKLAVAYAESRFGNINGVVHCAGMNYIGLTYQESEENARDIFPAKVHGAFYLDEIFSGHVLDFFVLLSSQSSYLSSQGQGLYSAANNVVDILAARRSRLDRGLCFAIGYGAFKEVGMATTELTELAKNQDGYREISSTSPSLEITNHPFIVSKQLCDESHIVYSGLYNDDKSWVYDHRFNGQALISAVTILECVRAAHADRIGNTQPMELSQVAFLRPLFVDKEGTQVEFTFTLDGGIEHFEVRTRCKESNGEWTINVTGRLSTPIVKPDNYTGPIPSEFTNDTTWSRKSGGFTRGERWECVEGINVDGDSTWGKLKLDDAYRSDFDDYFLHPAMFDRAIHVPCWRFFNEDHAPYAIKTLRIYGALPADFFVHGTRKPDDRFQAYDMRLLDASGNTLVDIEDYVLRAISESGDSASYDATDSSFTSSTKLEENQKLVLSAPGDLDSICAKNCEPRKPGPGEVQIDVIAAGLNFRDLLIALGQYPSEGGNVPEFGNDSSGVIRAVGDATTDLKPGDPVISIHGNAFATSLTTKTDYVVPVSPNLTMEDAAGIPTIFVTAELALNHLAKLKKKERILIHAATGGVGLAAIQLAKLVGAEIYATAGSPAKRQYLNDIGIEYVSDSRSLEFVSDIQEWTNGEGVDVVLNSLAGEYISASLSLLRFKGRFLELGKRDIFADMKLGLYPFRNNLAYYAIDIGQLITEEDPLLPRMLESLMARFARGKLKPVPTTVIPVSDAVGGFRRMARAEHIGKNVLKIQRDPDIWREIHKRYLERFGDGLSIKEGMEIFRKALSSNTTPPYVLAPAMELDRAQQGSFKVTMGQGARPDLATSYRSATNRDEEILVEIWENTLGVSPIGIDDNFFDLGGDSITAIQVQYSISKRFDINLPMTTLFDHTSICEIASVVGNASS